MAFIVLALPRSRTKWLSGFLSAGDWICGHDELQHMRSLEDVAAWWSQPWVGTVETAAAPFWRLLPPGIRIVTVRRRPQAVLDSVMRAVPGCDPTSMAKLLGSLDRKLDQVEARVPGVLRIEYDDLARAAVCARLFEFCLPYPHDPQHWAMWNARHVSGNLAAQVRYCAAYLPQLRKLARAARHRILANMAPVERPGTWDGFTFEDVSIDRWYAEATALFREHMAVTGQDIDDWGRKNLPLGRRLDALGAMQIITAWSNGKMFGYLMAVISPSLDDPAALIAQHLPVYASPCCPGLGMKLQRASLAALQRKGVAEVLARAGTRGSGPRLGAVYRRLGFEDAGQMYRLNLTEARPWA